MPKDFPEQRSPQVVDAHEFAESSDVSEADRALLRSAVAEAERDAADRQPGTLADDEDVGADVGTAPVGPDEVARAEGGDGENEDGLDETEEAVRQDAEDKPLGGLEDYKG